MISTCNLHSWQNTFTASLRPQTDEEIVLYRQSTNLASFPVHDMSKTLYGMLSSVQPPILATPPVSWTRLMLNTVQIRELAARNRHHHSKFTVCLVGFRTSCYSLTVH